MGVQFWSWVFAIVALLVLGGITALFTKKDPLVDRIGGDVIPVDSLPTFRSFAPGVWSAALIRQSGNLHRDLGTFPSAQAALDEAVKSFRRAKVTDVRITHASDTELAAYRQIYNLRGRAEGKKMAGVRMVLVSPTRDLAPTTPPKAVTSYEQVTIAGLRIQLIDVIKGDDDRYTLMVDYRCAKCGGEDVKTETGLALEAMRCGTCGTEFERLGDVQAIQRGLMQQYLASTGLSVASINGR